MGSLQAQAMSELVAEGEVKLRAALHWHLRSNHYPPLPIGAVGVALEAIEEANRGAFGVKVDTSLVGTHRVYGTQVPVREIIEAWHLQAFVNWEGDDED